MALMNVQKLLNQLADAEIIYCHWKSNVDIDVSLNGETDLDILVNRKQQKLLVKILADSGFIAFNNIAEKSYPGIVDYLSLDETTGKLVHLHLHYELTLGEKYIKSYQPPWAQLALSSRVLQKERKIYVIDPNLEMILLLTRATLKIQTRQRFTATPIDSKSLYEFKFLQSQLSKPLFRNYSESLFSMQLADEFNKLAFGYPTKGDLQKLFKPLSHELANYRMYNCLETQLIRNYREIVIKSRTIVRKLFNWSLPLGKSSHGGGRVIAVVGIDGSGKSSTTKTLYKWLASKLDISFEYMGCGDGPGLLYRTFFQKIQRTVSSMLGKKGESYQVNTKHGFRGSTVFQPHSSLYTVSKIVWGIIVAHEKKIKLKRLLRAKNRGLLVLCDRYPQTLISGMDGPIFSSWRNHKNHLLRRLAKWEFNIYKLADQCPPDVVYKLIVTVETASQRKPETPLDEVTRKHNQLTQLAFPESTTVVEIDAEQAFEKVILKIQRSLWSEI